MAIFQPALATSYITRLHSEVSSSIILRPAPITSSGATKLECNEVTGGLSAPVQELSHSVLACVLGILSYHLILAMWRRQLMWD